MNIGRRVFDRWTGDYGTVVDGPFYQGSWRVAWDNPTPLQDSARPVIPSAPFVWADEIGAPFVWADEIGPVSDSED